MTAVVCDFCRDPDPAWDYPAADFMFTPRPGEQALGLPPQRSTGSWLACDVCHTLIEEGRWRDLAARATALFTQRTDTTGIPRELLAAEATRAHLAFREHRNGPAARRVST